MARLVAVLFAFSSSEIPSIRVVIDKSRLGRLLRFPSVNGLVANVKESTNEIRGPATIALGANDTRATRDDKKKAEHRLRRSIISWFIATSVDICVLFREPVLFRVFPSMFVVGDFDDDGKDIAGCFGHE
jgi:hypothetical protein